MFVALQRLSPEIARPRSPAAVDLRPGGHRRADQVPPAVNGADADRGGCGTCHWELISMSHSTVAGVDVSVTIDRRWLAPVRPDSSEAYKPGSLLAQIRGTWPREEARPAFTRNRPATVRARWSCLHLDGHQISRRAVQNHLPDKTVKCHHRHRLRCRSRLPTTDWFINEQQHWCQRRQITYRRGRATRTTLPDRAEELDGGTQSGRLSPRHRAEAPTKFRRQSKLTTLYPAKPMGSLRRQGVQKHDSDHPVSRGRPPGHQNSAAA